MNNDKIAILIKKAALAAEKKLTPCLQAYDLSVSQYKFLKYLYSEPKDSVRLIDLENAYAMSHPAAIDILKVLEKKGYTCRIANPADGRSRIVSLTDKAYAQAEELEKLGEVMEEKITENLNEEEKEQLKILLKRIIAA